MSKTIFFEHKAHSLYFLLFWMLLGAGISFSPPKFIYDEGLHFGVVEMIRKDGFVEAMLSPINQSAAGPLYSYAHIAISSISHFSAPGIRWLNFVSLILVAFLVSKCARPSPKVNFPEASACLLGVPFVWPCVGMALTELPALLFFTFGLFCIRAMLDADKSRGLWIWALAGGISLGVSILGRQTYLIVLPVVFFWGLFIQKIRWATLGMAAAALASSFWIFWLWGGLVPPAQAAVDGGIRLDHSILAGIYIGMAGLILAPCVVKESSIKLSIFAFLCAGVISYILFDGKIIPARSLLIGLVGGELAAIWGGLAMAGMAGISAVWFVGLFRRVVGLKDSFLFLNALLLLAFLAAPAKISHLFSSRYVVTAIVPLIFLTGFERSLPSIGLKILGCLVGFGTLASYYGWI